MKVVVFGASGMIGHGVLLECLEDPEVASVVTVVRRPMGLDNAKLTEVVHADFLDDTPIESKLAGLDACFFCLGVSSAGMKEPEYTKVTYDFAMAAAKTLAKASPGLTFCFVSGAGTNAASNTMWARVKGKTENAILEMFPQSFCFRPGYIHPMKGVVSGTPWLRKFYVVLRPLYPLLKAVFPGVVTTTENMGRAMINAVRTPPAKRVLEVRDINALAGGAS